MKILLTAVVSIGVALSTGLTGSGAAVAAGNRLSPSIALLASSSAKQDSAVDYFERGNLKQEREDYYGAIADYTKFIRKNSNHSAAYRQRGFAKAMVNDLRGSLNDLNAALFLDPRHADTYNARGNVRALIGSLKSSIRDFDRAIELDRSFADAYYNRGISRHGLKDLNYSASKEISAAISRL
jgi:tetratricopeptide (TPR) repeat protein